MTSQRLDRINATDLMSKPVIIARYDTALTEIVVLLRQNEIRHLPIVNDGGQLIGILSNRDMLVATNTPANVDGLRWASHIMTPDPITITPEHSATQAATLLIQHRIGCLPVIDNNQIVGIITESDFVRYFAQFKDT